MSAEPYDSRPETLEHIDQVRARLYRARLNLEDRARVHDESKLESPELEAFDRMTPLLAELEYGSDEYKAALRELGPALQHHYEENSHHPEHYARGIRGMSLLDLIEMLCDWSAAAMRVKQGALTVESLQFNQQRFGYSDELADIFLNTLRELKLVG